MKTCKALGCDKPISHTRLMCFEHWSQVPKDIQDRVWKTARAYQKIDVISPRFGIVRKEYYAAAKEAMKAVAGNEFDELTKPSKAPF